MRIKAKSETNFVTDFIDDSKAEFAPDLWIKRIIDTIHLGTPDIYAHFNGIFLPIEAKKGFRRNGLILDHHFKPIQIHELMMLKKSRAYSMGLIFMDNEMRFILPEEIPENGNLNLDSFNKLPHFSWRTILDEYNIRSKSIAQKQ